MWSQSVLVELKVTVANIAIVANVVVVEYPDFVMIVAACFAVVA